MRAALLSDPAARERLRRACEEDLAANRRRAPMRQNLRHPAPDERLEEFHLWAGIDRRRRIDWPCVAIWVGLGLVSYGLLAVVVWVAGKVL
mgnify:FL=1